MHLSDAKSNFREPTMDRKERLELLKDLNVGKQIAEEERLELQKYFLDTNAWERLTSNDVDIVFGSKGYGKSALYILLLGKAKVHDLKGVSILAGENPAGNAIFQSLQKQKPALSEDDLLIFWKAFFLALAGAEVQRLNLPGSFGLTKRLQEWGLIPFEGLEGAFARAISFFRRLEVEAGAEVDPTGHLKPTFKAKLQKVEPALQVSDELNKSLTELDQLCLKAKRSFWIALDRLDVAFQEDADLEARALRALFRTYSDFRAFGNVRLKIFIRDDLWARITTKKGFREASHIIRTLVIGWDSQSLLNLIVRRILSSDRICRTLEVKREDVLSDFSLQQETFYRIFPEQVEQGQKRRKTWEWILTRIQDGSDKAAPRELIHLVDAARLAEIRRLEQGAKQADSLISPLAIEQALLEVSRMKLESAIYQEYPDLKPHLEKLRKKKTEHSRKSLAKLFGLSEIDAEIIIKQLVERGILKVRETGFYWVPFLYREALQMVQGKSA